MTNQQRLIKAANWALQHENEPDVGINIRRMNVNGRRNMAIFNGAKTLLFTGYTNPHQAQLKGLIVEETDKVATKVLAGCFPKFYNYGEPNEKMQHATYLERDDIRICFYEKMDGTNIRPYWNAASNRVEFATRSMLIGTMDEESGYFDFGGAAREIAAERYPILLDADFVQKYSLVFELIHPDNRIVTHYGEDKDLILLAGFDLDDNVRELTRRELNKLRSLSRVRPLMLSIVPSEFDHAVESLKEKWLGTDKEGTVAVFINQAEEPVYRLKIKNAEYLEMMRLSRYCTLRRTKQLMEENELLEWEEVRSHLYKTAPNMNEELEMAYKVHFDAIKAWTEAIFNHVLDMHVMYKDIPAEFKQNQKDFALYVLEHLKPYSAFMFEIKKNPSVVWSQKTCIIGRKRYTPRWNRRRGGARVIWFFFYTISYMEIQAYRTNSGVQLVPMTQHRKWMAETPSGFAQRCLPLLIANQVGWTVLNPVAFTAAWRGGVVVNDVLVLPNVAGEKPMGMTHFGSGILTFTVPFLFRTPPGYQLYIKGPANEPRDGISALEGIVETDWTTSTFTMNWKFTRANLPVIFEKDEPICQILIQRLSDYEDAQISVETIHHAPEETRESYLAFCNSRNTFNSNLRTGDPEVLKKSWEKHYMRGCTADGIEAPEHRTKIKHKPIIDVK